MNTFFCLLKNKFLNIVFLIFFFSISSIAQIKQVFIGVNGLTCSACSRAVEMSIRKLDFVQDVQMDLKNTEGKILFVKGKTISIEKIAQAVFDAGFSVRFLKADITIENLSVTNNFCYDDGNAFYQFIGINNQKLVGDVMLTFLGKKYLSNKDFKKWKLLLKPNCSDATKKLYYVTL